MPGKALKVQDQAFSGYSHTSHLGLICGSPKVQQMEANSEWTENVLCTCDWAV